MSNSPQGKCQDSEGNGLNETVYARLSLAGLAHRCKQESIRFFQQVPHNPRYCYELFRRAIVNERQSAWDCVYGQYEALVRTWVERHPQFALCDEDVEFFVNRAFEKMWNALSPEKFQGFTDLRALLRYMKLCVNAVIIDHIRTQKELPTQIPDNQAITIEQPVEERVMQQDLWRMIDARLNDERERIAMVCRYRAGMMPREIQAAYPEDFAKVTDVHRTLQNVLARLRRDNELQEFFAERG